MHVIGLTIALVEGNQRSIPGTSILQEIHKIPIKFQQKLTENLGARQPRMYITFVI